MTWTPTTLTMKDADGNEQPIIAYTDGTNFSLAHPLLDDTGAIIKPATAGKQDLTNTALGVPADAAVTSPASSGSIIGFLKGILTGLNAEIPAGANVIGKVAVDQTTPGTTDSVTVATGQGAGATIGAVSDASVAAGAAGSLSAKLRRATQGLEDLKSLIVLAAGSAIIGKVGIDQTTPGATNLVYLPQPRIVTGNTTTRPANTTAYTAGQLVANSTTAGSVTYPTIAAALANDVAGTILRLRLKKSGTTLTNGLFRVHLYNVQPTVSNGDGGAWLSTTAGYQGAFDVTMTQAFTDSCMGFGVPTAGSALAFNPASGTQNLYYLIEARGPYTPASGEVLTPYLEIAQ